MRIWSHCSPGRGGVTLHAVRDVPANSRGVHADAEDMTGATTPLHSRPRACHAWLEQAPVSPAAHDSCFGGQSESSAGGLCDHIRGFRSQTKNLCPSCHRCHRNSGSTACVLSSRTSQRPHDVHLVLRASTVRSSVGPSRTASPTRAALNSYYARQRGVKANVKHPAAEENIGGSPRSSSEWSFSRPSSPAANWSVPMQVATRIHEFTRRTALRPASSNSPWPKHDVKCTCGPAVPHPNEGTVRPCQVWISRCKQWIIGPETVN